MDNKAHIMPMQFMFCISCFVQASALLSSFFIPITQHDSWISVLLGMLIFAPLLLIYLSLIRKFPGKTLIEINETVFGRIGGFIISLLFIWFLITLTTLNTLDIGQLVKQTIMDKTPLVVLTTLCILVCAYAVCQGIRVVARYSIAFTLLSVGLVVTASLLTLNLWDMDNFLPMFDRPLINYVQSTHLAVTIPFGELVAFLMIVPTVQKTQKNLRRYMFGGFVIGGLTILSVVVRDTAVLGNTIGLFAMPPFETQRLATLAEDLSRLEILYVIVLILLLFFKILVLYYATVVAVAQLFKLKSYRPIVLLMGALFVSYAIFIYPNEVDHLASARQTTAQIWTVFQLILPVTVLVTAYARRLPKKNAAKGV